MARSFLPFYLNEDQFTRINMLPLSNREYFSYFPSYFAYIIPARFEFLQNLYQLLSSNNRWISMAINSERFNKYLKDSLIFHRALVTTRHFFVE